MALPIFPILLVLGAGALLVSKLRSRAGSTPPPLATSTLDDFEILPRGEAVVAVGVPDKKYSLPDGTVLAAGDARVDAFLAANVDKGSMVSLALRNKTTHEVVPAVVLVSSVVSTSFGPSYGGPTADPSKATAASTLEAKGIAAALRGPKPGTLLVFGAPQILDASPPPGTPWKLPPSETYST